VTELLRTSAEAKGAIFLLGETVTAIAGPSEGSSSITVTTSSSIGTIGSYAGRTAICTIPLGVLKTFPSTFFTPPLPARKANAIAQAPFGSLAKVVLGYEQPWWPADVSSYTILPASNVKPSATDPKALLASIPLVVTAFASGVLPPPHPTLLIYVSAGVAKEIEALDPVSVAAAMHELLVSRILSPTANAPAPNHTAVTSWSRDPLTLGATTTPSLVGGSPLLFLELGRPAWGGLLGFAGEHTDPDHRGSVSGALISGAREADRVQKVLKRLQRMQGA